MRKMNFEEMPDKLNVSKLTIDKLVASGRSEEEAIAEAFRDANSNSALRKDRKFVQACLDKGYIYVASPKERAIRNIAASASRGYSPFDKSYYYTNGEFIKGRYYQLNPIGESYCDILIDQLEAFLDIREFEALMYKEGLIGDNPTTKGICAALHISAPTLHHIVAKAYRKLTTPSGRRLVDLMRSDNELISESQALVLERTLLEHEPAVQRYLEITESLKYHKTQLSGLGYVLELDEENGTE